MSHSNEIDQATVDTVQALIRWNLAGRDNLYTAAERIEADAMRRVCRRLADELGANVADLQQLLMARGVPPIDPADPVVGLLREIVLEVLEQESQGEDVTNGAASVQHTLTKQYDAVADEANDEPIRNAVDQQRDKVERGKDVLDAIGEARRSSKDGGK